MARLSVISWKFFSMSSTFSAHSFTSMNLSEVVTSAVQVNVPTALFCVQTYQSIRTRLFSSLSVPTAVA